MPQRRTVCGNCFTNFKLFYMSQLWSKLLFTLALAVGFVWLIVTKIPDNNLHLIFCDVGQGDAILVTYKTTQILIDGGPDRKVLDCLAKFMPIWDHQIEAILLTHPQADHATGLISVIRRYQISSFLTTLLHPTAQFANTLEQELNHQSVPVVFSDSTTSLRYSLVKLDIVWPTPQFLATTNNDPTCLAQKDDHVLGCRTTPQDLNFFSQVVHLKFNQFDALLTGDADSQVQGEILATGQIFPVEILKFPHHGSKTGLAPQFLHQVSPQLAVISVGKNSYGHPTPEALNLLDQNHAPYLRTDQVGDIEVITNGTTWWINHQL